MSDIKEATVPTLVFGEVFEEKQVPVEYYPLEHYKACGIIKKLADT